MSPPVLPRVSAVSAFLSCVFKVINGFIINKLTRNLANNRSREAALFTLNYTKATIEINPLCPHMMNKEFGSSHERVTSHR